MDISWEARRGEASTERAALILARVRPPVPDLTASLLTPEALGDPVLEHPLTPPGPTEEPDLAWASCLSRHRAGDTGRGGPWPDCCPDLEPDQEVVTPPCLDLHPEEPGSTGGGEGGAQGRPSPMQERYPVNSLRTDPVPWLGGPGGKHLGARVSHSHDHWCAPPPQEGESGTPPLAAWWEGPCGTRGWRCTQAAAPPRTREQTQAGPQGMPVFNQEPWPPMGRETSGLLPGCWEPPHRQ